MRGGSGDLGSQSAERGTKFFTQTKYSVLCLTAEVRTELSKRK